MWPPCILGLLGQLMPFFAFEIHLAGLLITRHCIDPESLLKDWMDGWVYERQADCQV